MFLVRLRICDDHISDTNLKYFRYTLPTFIKGRMVTLGTKDWAHSIVFRIRHVGRGTIL